MGPPFFLCGGSLCLPDLTRVKSGRACLPRAGAKGASPVRRAPIANIQIADGPLACAAATAKTPPGLPLAGRKWRAVD